jgi:hypothetical protein
MVAETYIHDSRTKLFESQCFNLNLIITYSGAEERLLRRLVIIPSSRRVVKEPAEPIPALQRLDGVFVRLVRKYYNQLYDTDVLILSLPYGLIKAEARIGYKEPIIGDWRKPVLSESDIKRLKKSTISELKNIFSKKQYDEVYITLGKNIMKSIEGFGKVIPESTKVTYAQGKGIGPKITHMKIWIESQIRRD